MATLLCRSEASAECLKSCIQSLGTQMAITVGGKDSGPIEVYGKTDFCKHFAAEFMDSVTHSGSD